MVNTMTNHGITATGANPWPGSVILFMPLPRAPAAEHAVMALTVEHAQDYRMDSYQCPSKPYPGTALSSEDTINRQLASFFEEWQQRAFYIAYAALWDKESALDVVQESMTRLIEYYRNKPEKEWPALFRTILNSKINDMRRRRIIEQGKHKLLSLTGLFQNDPARATDKTEYELPADDREDDITAPEAEVVAGELRSRVADALQALSERQRQVFILREWRGMSIHETALTLGCSENSVKQHHFRAMRALREQLAEVWNHAQPTTP